MGSLFSHSTGCAKSGHAAICAVHSVLSSDDILVHVRAELCPPSTHMWKLQPPGTQGVTVTVFGNGVSD